MSETRTKARALLAAATPGPWMLNGDASQHGHFGVCAVDDPIADVWGGRENAKGPANATLIAAAPDIIATLIAEADASEQRVDVLRGLADTAAAEQGLAQRRMMEAQEARSAAERRAAEAEAGAAAMRDVLTRLLQYDRPRVCGVARGASTSHCRLCGFPNMEHAPDCPGGMALAGSAGRAFLEQLEHIKSDLDAIRAKLEPKRGPLRDGCPNNCDRGVIGVDGPGPDESRDYPCPHCEPQGETIRLLRNDRATLLDRLERAEAERDLAIGQRDAARANLAERDAQLVNQNAGLAQMARERDEARAERDALRSENARFKARESEFASALAVADGGQYRADWDGAIRRVLSERDALRAKLSGIEAERKLRIESADPDDETWHTREEYLGRIKAEAERDALRVVNADLTAKM